VFSLFLKQKVLMIKNSFTLGGLMRRLPFIVLGIGFWLLLYLGTYKALSFLRGIGISGEILSERLLSLVLLGLTGFLALSTVITSLSSFYLSRDIPFLLAHPLETSDIVKLKSFESVLLSSWMAALFIVPVFIAYGASYHAPALYYAVSSFALLLLILIAAGIGMTAAHLVTKVFPAKRSREVLLALGLVLFLIFYFVIKSTLPQGDGSPEDFLKTFEVFRTDSPLLPGYWVMRTVLPLIRGRTPGVSYMALLLGSGVFFLFAAQVVGRRFYRRNLEKIRPSEDKRGPLPDRSYPRPGYAVFFKDIRVFFRDTGQWTQIFIISALMMVYIYNFKSMPLSAIMGLFPFAKEILVIANLFMTGLVLTAMAARFLFTSVSFEGRAFWVVRSAPLSVKRFLWSKFLYWCIPITAIVIFLISLTNYVLKVNGPLLLLSEGTALLLSVSVCGLGAGLGAAFPKFEYENIASVAIGMGAMTFMLIAFGLVIVTLSAGAWGYYSYAAKIGAGGSHTAESMRIALCLFFVFIINAAAFYLPMRAGIRKLRKMQF
jgi:ABC-2 type transport system permease protein